MKKVFYAVMALAAILVSCSKEVDYIDEEIPGTGKLVTLHANVEQQTKVSADNAGAYSWQIGDAISVLNNSGEATEFTTTSAGTSVDFSGSFASGTLGNFAMYPACDDHTASENAVTFSLPATLTWSANATNMPMLGKIESDNVSFKAVGGVLKLVCYNIPSGAEYLRFVATNKQVVGNFAIADGTVASPSIVTADKEGSNNVLDIDFSTNYSANKVFYIPLPTGTIDGFTVKILDGGKDELFSKTTTASLAVVRNKLIIGPALNCGLVTTKTLTNEEILASEITGSYANGSITSESGTWNYNACKQVNHLQIRKNATVSYLQLPSFAKNISSITLHGIANGSSAAYTGDVYLRSTAENDVASIASATCNVDAEGDFVLNIPTGTKTGYLMSSGACRFTSVTVAFETDGTSAPSLTLTPDNEELTIVVGSTTATTGLTYANKVDDLPVAALVSEGAKAWLSAEVTGTYPDYTLTVTASGAHNGASDRTGTVTLRASGVNKQIAVTQKTALVPNPTVTATPGNEKFSASWTGIANATSYVAYLRTTEGTPTDGTNISTSISESAGTYSITDYAVENGTYYLYVKVNGVAANYEAPADYVMRTFTCEGTPKGTDPANPYTASEARALAIGGDTGSYYISGTVTKVQNQYSAGYGTANFWIDENGTSDNVFEGYKIKYFGNVNWVEGNGQIAVDDEVIIYGTLTYYNETTPETSSGYLVSLNGKTKGLTPGSLSTSKDDANKQITVTWGAATGTESAISYVVNCGAQSYNANAAGSHTFTMADYTTYAISVVASATDAISATASTSVTLNDPNAGEPTVYTIQWGSDYNGSSVSSYTASWNATKDGFTVNMANFNNNNNGWDYVKCGRKNNASVATIITDSAISDAIKTVTITIDALTVANINSITLYVSDSKESGWASAGTFTKATGNQPVTIASPAANKYYKLEFDCASGSSNGLLTLSKAQFSTN